jgi:hypothetical protein
MRIWEQDETRKIRDEHERSSGPSHVVVGGNAAQQPDEWLRTTVWVLDEIGGGNQGR